MYARYTEYLRDIMMNEHTAQALQKALSTYPLYKPEKLIDLIPERDALNTKILNHFKYREIGFETLGRFLDELEITMNEIMPRYNELFKSIEIMANLDNPFDNVDVTETYEEHRSGTSSSEGSTTNSSTSSGTQTGTDETSQSGSTSTQNDTSTSNEASETGTSSSTQKTNSKSIESDTPQNQLSIGAKDIDSVDYASNAKWDGSEGEGSSENSSTSENTSETSETSESSSENTTSGSHSNTTETEGSETGTSSVSGESSETISHTFHKKGNQGVTTYARDMNEFRTSIIDVVDQIINDSRLNELFMMVY